MGSSATTFGTDDKRNDTRSERIGAGGAVVDIGSTSQSPTSVSITENYGGYRAADVVSIIDAFRNVGVPSLTSQNDYTGRQPQPNTGGGGNAGGLGYVALQGSAGAPAATSAQLGSLLSPDNLKALAPALFAVGAVALFMTLGGRRR